MRSGRLNVRHELLWLSSGPLHRVHLDAQPHLDAFLERFAFRRIDLDGRTMTSRTTAHEALARAFGFPDHYGRNWDAFSDCFGDFSAKHSGELLALVWKHADAAASAAPATAIETGAALLEARTTADLAVFVLGAGTDFDRP